MYREYLPYLVLNTRDLSLFWWTHPKSNIGKGGEVDDVMGWRGG